MFSQRLQTVLELTITIASDGFFLQPMKKYFETEEQARLFHQIHYPASQLNISRMLGCKEYDTWSAYGIKNDITFLTPERPVFKVGSVEYLITEHDLLRALRQPDNIVPVHQLISSNRQEHRLRLATSSRLEDCSFLIYVNQDKKCVAINSWSTRAPVESFEMHANNAERLGVIQHHK